MTHKKENFEDKVSEVDAVYDTVGGPVTNKSLLVIKPGGILVTMVGNPDLELAKKYKIMALLQSTKVNNSHLKRLTQLVEEGKIKVNLDKTFPLDEIKEAFIYQKENHPQGKVVIKIKD